MSNPLPVISLMNSLMTVQAYLHAASTARLPPAIAQEPPYGTLVTNFENWQAALWLQFWEGLVSHISAAATEIDNLTSGGATEQSMMQAVFFDDTGSIVAGQVDAVTALVNAGEVQLQKLDGVAKSIESADQQAVAQLTKTADQLSSQFDQQEDKLTQSALNTGADIVITCVAVMVAVGSEGEVTTPLIKGVNKLASDVSNELSLSSEIEQTLGQLEAAWQKLDQASAELAQVTLACNQLDAITGQSSAALTALANLRSDWSTVAQSTEVSASEWANGGSAALQQWAAQMTQLSFAAPVTQTVSAS